MRSWTQIKNFFGIGYLELRTLNFSELTTAKFPNAQWRDLSGVEQAEIIREGLQPQECLLDPQCQYLKYWDIVILCALCYTAFVTPYEVAFLQTSLNPLFVFNRFIDVIFFKDMIMQFFLKVQVRELRGTIWIRDRKTIIKKYVKGWFFIDLCSILPFDTVGLVLQNPAVQKLKVIRIVRLLRLLKLVRMLRASRIIKRWENRTSMSYSMQGLCKFAMLLCISTHWMACIWGMAGLLLASDLKCFNEDGQAFNDREYVIEETQFGGSWVTARDWGPNSPCQHIDAYLAAAHFAVMTITSIGYGDIVPGRNEELALGCMCQLVGGLTWAFVIGSICGIIQSSNPVRIAFEQSMDALNAMLKEQCVEYDTCCQLREYLREQQYHYLLIRAREISKNFSMDLQGLLIPQTAMGVAISHVWYFQGVPQSFVVELTQRLDAHQHGPREKVGGIHQLSIVQRGSVVRLSRILLPGDFWGEDMVLESQFLIDRTTGLALSYVELLSLQKSTLNSVLAYYPEVAKKIRKAAIMIAFKAAVRILLKEAEEKKMKDEKLSRSSTKKRLSEAGGARIIGIFDSLNADPNTQNQPSLTELLLNNKGDDSRNQDHGSRRGSSARRMSNPLLNPLSVSDQLRPASRARCGDPSPRPSEACVCHASLCSRLGNLEAAVENTNQMVRSLCESLSAPQGNSDAVAGLHPLRALATGRLDPVIIPQGPATPAGIQPEGFPLAANPLSPSKGPWDLPGIPGPPE